MLEETRVFAFHDCHQNEEIPNAATMNAYQSRRTPSYGCDGGYSSFQSVGMPICGYDASVGRFTALNLEALVGDEAKFRKFTGKERGVIRG